MIKILHCELDSNVGGIESFLKNLSKSIDYSEVQFDFLTKCSNPAFKSDFESLGCNIIKVPADVVRYCCSVKRILSEGEYNIIHIHKNSAANIILPVIVKTTSAVMIIHSHNTKPSISNILTNILHAVNRNILNKMADKKLACSDLAAQWLFGKDENVQIIRNGIIAKDYVFDISKRSKIRERLKVKDKFVIGNVGRFSKQKNHKVLIEILAALDDSYVLLLIGDGELKKEIEEYSRDLNVRERILFMGIREDVADLLQGMDVFAMPSLYEGLPIAGIEAQAAGLPVLISENSSKMLDITGNVEFLDINDINSWCSSIRNIRNNYKRKNTLTQIIESGFDMTNESHILKELYKDLAS